MLTEHTSAVHLFQHLNVHYFIVIICHIVSHLILSFLRRAKENIYLIFLSWFVIGSCQAYSVLTKHEFQSTNLIGIFFHGLFLCVYVPSIIFHRNIGELTFFFNILGFFLTFFFKHFSSHFHYFILKFTDIIVSVNQLIQSQFLELLCSIYDIGFFFNH